MGQNIEIFIAGKSFRFQVSQEQEEIMRKAAVEINSRIKFWQDKFPEKTLTEILSIIALKSGMTNIALKNGIGKIEAEEKKLAGELENYLENIEKDRKSVV